MTGPTLIQSVAPPVATPEEENNEQKCRRTEHVSGGADAVLSLSDGVDPGGCLLRKSRQVSVIWRISLPAGIMRLLDAPVVVVGKNEELAVSVHAYQGVQTSIQLWRKDEVPDCSEEK